MRLVCADVMEAPLSPRLDVIADLNFSICEVRERPALGAYLRRCRDRLRQGGVFVCDIYGGSDAFLTGRVRETKAGPRGERLPCSQLRTVSIGTPIRAANSAWVNLARARMPLA